MKKRPTFLKRENMQLHFSRNVSERYAMPFIAYTYIYVYMLYVQTNIIQKYVCTSGTQHIQTKYKIMQYKMKYELKCSCYLF